MTSKSKRYCSVPQCKNYKSETVSIHYFPKDPVFLNKWVTALRINKPVTKFMSVCSDHFVQNDFFPRHPFSKRKCLKLGVVPSQKIPARIFDNPKSSRPARVPRTQNRCDKRELQIENIDLDNSDTRDAEETAEFMATDLILQEDPLSIVQEKRQVDKCLQVNLLSSRNEIRFHEYLLTSSKKLSVYTGINLEIFRLLSAIVNKTLKQFPKLSPDSTEKKICLVLTKLKLDISFHALAIMYEVSTITAQNYFHDYIHVLYLALNRAIYFPTKDANLLKNFSNYSEVKSILEVIRKHKQIADHERTQ